MSSRLLVLQDDRLPENHDCQGCPSNCCDQIIIGHKATLFLPSHYPRQPAAQELLDRLTPIVLESLQPKIDSNIHRLSLDGRFTPLGFRILPPPADFMANIVRTCAGPVAVFRAIITIILQCSAFDSENDLCTDYQNRPAMCRQYSPKRCGLSQNHPTHSKTGTPFDRSATIAHLQDMRSHLDSTLKSALSRFMKGDSPFVPGIYRRRRSKNQKQSPKNSKAR